MSGRVTSLPVRHSTLKTESYQPIADVAPQYNKTRKHMADEEMDDEDTSLPDEKLDGELDNTSDTSGDDTDTSDTSEDEQDQSTSTNDEESEDDEDDESDTSDATNRTPEQIAKYERKRRKKAEKELRDLKSAGRTGDDDNSGKSKDDFELPPGGLAERVWNTVVKVDIAELAQTDSTVIQRTGAIKDIIFKEMKWLQKDPNGVRIANDIAKGRMVKPTPGVDGQDGTIQRKTTPAKPRNGSSGDGFKRLSQSEFNNLNASDQITYEEQLRAHLSKK